jgi:hypothetical protein
MQVSGAIGRELAADSEDLKLLCIADKVPTYVRTFVVLVSGLFSLSLMCVYNLGNFPLMRDHPQISSGGLAMEPGHLWSR